jgi:hypothetical protein
MEVFLFIVFVAACALFLYWANNNSNKNVDRVHKRELREPKSGAERLETPAVYTLGRPNQPWHTRGHPATTVDSKPDQQPPPKSAELEYDGYSRRDRHHVIESKAHIKDEGHLEDPAAGDKRWGEHGLAH